MFVYPYSVRKETIYKDIAIQPIWISENVICERYLEKMIV